MTISERLTIKKKQKGSELVAYICPYCGEKKESISKCSSCGADREDILRVTGHSNAFYNIGLKKALDNDITNAIVNLKKSLFWNKYNIVSYNLLGLLYYKIGNIGDALKEWIIASSLDKEDSTSKSYIEKIQRKPKELESYKESINLYNKALDHLAGKNRDVAIIRLKKAININSNLAEARILLALCYMEDKNFKKAREQLINAIKIDGGNIKTHRYLFMLNEEANSNDIYEEKKIKEKKAHKIDKSIRSSTRSVFTNYILYFLLGAFIMLVAEKFLIQPTQIEGYTNEMNMIIGQKEEEERKFDEFKKEYISKVAELQKTNTSLQKKNKENESLIDRYIIDDKLQEASKYSDENEYVLAASTIYGINKLLLEEDQNKIYEKVKEKSYKKAADILYREGLQYYNNQDYVSSKIAFEKVIVYDKESWIVRKSMYYLAEIEYTLGNLNQANNYYKKVIEGFPGTEEARLSVQKIE